MRDIDCPEYVVALVERIADEVARLEWNRTQQEWASPLQNTGARWSNDTFSMRAYYWGDDEAEADVPNFKCGDIEIEWYKHVRRGALINRTITPDEAVAMFDRCMASLAEMDRTFWDSEGGLF